jgi:hypothetical protein
VQKASLEADQQSGSKQHVTTPEFAHTCRPDSQWAVVVFRLCRIRFPAWSAWLTTHCSALTGARWDCWMAGGMLALT